MGSKDPTSKGVYYGLQQHIKNVRLGTEKSFLPYRKG